MKPVRVSNFWLSAECTLLIFRFDITAFEVNTVSYSYLSNWREKLLSFSFVILGGILDEQKSTLLCMFKIKQYMSIKTVVIISNSIMYTNWIFWNPVDNSTWTFKWHLKWGLTFHHIKIVLVSTYFIGLYELYFGE